MTSRNLSRTRRLRRSRRSGQVHVMPPLSVAREELLHCSRLRPFGEPRHKACVVFPVPAMNLLHGAFEVNVELPSDCVRRPSNALLRSGTLGPDSAITQALTHQGTQVAVRNVLPPPLGHEPTQISSVRPETDINGCTT